MQLRPYQNATVNLTRLGFKEHLRQLMVLPTGGGKTVVFTSIASAAALKGTKVLILTDRTELHEQTIESIEPLGIRYCMIDANTKKVDKEATIFIAMVETFKRRFEANLTDINFGLIIADEAHMGNFSRIFELLPSVPTIGATATPVGKHLYKYYTNIVQEIDTPELVDTGFLVPCKAFQMVDDFSDLEQAGDDFSDKSNFGHFDKASLYDGVVKEYMTRAFGLKTVVFNVNIQHTINVYEAFKAAGISCEYVTSNTPKDERKRILKAFKDGHFKVLLNCGILTKGYNEPSIECIIVNRATKSLALWLQMVGRGSRLHPGKTHFLLLDFGGNHTRVGLGMWNEPRFWTLDQPSNKKKAAGIPPCKVCPGCEAILHATVTTCAYCDHVFEKSSEVKEGVMVEVAPWSPKEYEGRWISSLNTNELYELQKNKVEKATYIWRVNRSLGAQSVHAYAELAGYKTGWINSQLDKIDDKFFKDKRII